MTYLNYGPKQVQDILADTDDLGEIERALVREHAIRAAMARTGEGREIVAEGIDAIQSMDQEAVLDLTEGKPTTLPDALTRYIRIVETWDELITRDGVVSDLGAILEHPWPAEEERLASHGVNQWLGLRFKEGDDRDLEIRVGPDSGHPVYTVNWEDAGTGGQQAVKEAVRAVYRAVLSRVIADRDHHVQLSRTNRLDLLNWMDRPSGSWTGDSRVTVNAVEDGGILIRTRSYAYQHRIAQAQADQRREGLND